MKKFIYFSLICFAFASCKNNEPQQQTAATAEKAPAQAAIVEAAQNVLTPDETKAGFKLLFDGKTMAGWHNYKKTTIGKDWIVDSAAQAISLNVTKKADGHWQAEDGGDIMTVAAYENYELQVEWKIDTCGNSGIIYNVLEAPTADYVWHTGPEMQVLDNKCHPDAKIIKHRAGDLYDLISSSSEPVKAAGEWNHAEIKSNNGKLDFYLNGVHILNTTMWDDKWKQLVAGSKFKTMPGFGIFKKGHIALQEHGDEVWYKNFKIRRL